MRIGMPKNAKVAVSFEEELFKRICWIAVKEKKQFSVMVNELCKVGILCLEESDKLEPSESKHAELAVQ